MNGLGNKYSQDGVCLNSFDGGFVNKEVKCTNKTKTAQTAKWYNCIYTWGFSNELET